MFSVIMFTLLWIIMEAMNERADQGPDPEDDSAMPDHYRFYPEDFQAWLDRQRGER